MTESQQQAQPTAPKSPQCVRVTAADFNGTGFDGCPFSGVPEWLVKAQRDSKIVGHTRGSTDYAQWDVTTQTGVACAGPGDWIVRDENGNLYVCPHRLYVFAHAHGFAEGREAAVRGADAHKGNAKQSRVTKGRRLLMNQEVYESILDEERGEDIAATVIATAIRAIEGPEP